MSGNQRRAQVANQAPEDGSVDEVMAYLRCAAPQLLDGSHSLEQIWGKLLVAGFGPTMIHSALARLKREGGVDEADDDASLENSALTGQIALLGQLAAQEGMIADS